MSAEAVARTAEQWGVLISHDTVLPLVRAAPISSPGDIRVLGIDDLPFKQGQNYGALWIDLEKRPPVELLPDHY